MSASVVFALVVCAAPVADDATSQAWKVRAFKAAERLDTLAKTLAATPADLTARCDKALQTAFALHLTEPKLVSKANRDAAFFHVILQADKASVFDLAYVYKIKDGALAGARINELPKRWVVALTEGSRIFLRTPDGCTYQFDSKDPFLAETVPETVAESAAKRNDP